MAKITDISEILSPVLLQAKADGDKYCCVYFSRSQDRYAGEFDLDSGDALIVVEELVKFAKLDPQVLIEMLNDMSAPIRPFKAGIVLPK